MDRPVRASIIVPTYKEAENLGLLLERLSVALEGASVSYEILIMDDASKDGSAEIVAGLGDSRIRFIDRPDDHGLSQAVIDGMRRAKGSTLVVMDADLSHPPESVPQLIESIEAGNECCVGSRYVAGGSTDADWGISRWLNSKIATLLCRPLVKLQDPMAGFFAIPRSTFEAIKGQLDPVGYKIALEILVKGKINEVDEVPIHFTDRQHGDSKLTLKQKLLYLEHLRRLYWFRLSSGILQSFARFYIVGSIGTLINLSLTTLCLHQGASKMLATGIGTAVAILINFVLHRNWTFRDSLSGDAGGQLVRYATVAGISGSYVWGATQGLIALFPTWPVQLLQLVAIGSSTVLNFALSRRFAFKVDDSKNTIEAAPTLGTS